MRRIFKEVLSIVAALLITVSMVIGSSTIIKEFTDLQIIVFLFVVMVMTLALYIIKRFDKEVQKAYKEVYLHTLDEAYIKNFLHDWARNMITTKEALQGIDSIYKHHYTNNIRIKDGDK